MTSSDCLDNLIECVWRILKRESQETYCLPCREQCLDCLTRLVGPEHYYTQCFRDFGTNSNPLKLLGAVGVLTAAREEVAKRGSDSERPMAAE